MSRVLITGSAGFIGRHLMSRLKGMGHAVLGIDNMSSQVHGKRSVVPQGSVRMSVTDKSRVTSVIKEHAPEIVYHLAAETGVGQSSYRLERYVRTNVLGLGVVLEALQDRQVRVVLASSRAVYGDRGSRVGGVQEDEVLEPKSVYAETKLEQERLLLLSASQSCVRPLIFRLFNVYGPGQSLRNPYTGVLGTFALRALDSQDLIVYEDGLQTRDFVYIDDVVDALAELGSGSATGVVNIGSGRGVTIRRCAEMVAAACGGVSRIIVSGRTRVGDVRHCTASIVSAGKMGWTPGVAFEDGVPRYVNWVRQQPKVLDRSEAAWRELVHHGRGRVG